MAPGENEFDTPDLYLLPGSLQVFLKIINVMHDIMYLECGLFNMLVHF